MADHHEFCEILVCDVFVNVSVCVNISVSEIFLCGVGRQNTRPTRPATTVEGLQSAQDDKEHPGGGPALLAGRYGDDGDVNEWLTVGRL
ncbi:hypothetical protein, partial [Mycobacterium sp.]|uniref:hypothetical protein n=1 Tax=Mycobacterium sp. TaxID=1785 RepID=UPI0028BDAD27